MPDPTPHNALLEQYSKVIEELANERGARLVDLRNFDTVRSQRQVSSWPESFTDNGIHLHGRGHVEFAHWAIGKLGWWDGKADSGRFPSPTGSAASPRPAMDHEAIRAAVLRKNELFFHRFRPANSTYLFGFRKHEQGQNAKEMPEFDKLVEAADAEIDRLKRAASGEANAATPGSTRVSRVGSGVPPERTSTDAAASSDIAAATKVREGGTPSPARESRALPGATAAHVSGTPPPLPDFTVQDGYQIELWAENPLLEKPTEMNWDAQGRLWVCSSSLYPQIAPGEVAHDKILILSDTDRDGKADKSEVFVDDLLIPTGVVPDLAAMMNDELRMKNAPSSGSAATALNSESKIQNSKLSPAACYVGQSTELLHFTDTDGDGKADTKRVVFSGFGTEDTHHIIHTLRWGPDGRLYFNQSIYIHSHLETPWGMVRLNSGGVFAYDPRTERVEVLFKGFCNPWGHAWDQWGQSFLTDGAGFQGITWGIPGAMYFTYENGRKIAPSISPGNYPKFCGLELIHSPHFPAEWQGNAITCDFRAHRIVRFAIEDLSLDKENPRSGYVTKEQPDLLRTSDVSFRPIDVKHGPDGALYIADWSNPVINHGEVDFRDPRRDKHMGRIWRVTKKDAPLVKWEPLVGKKSEELLDGLLSKSLWEQEQARRVIRSRAVDEESVGNFTRPARTEQQKALEELFAWGANRSEGQGAIEDLLLRAGTGIAGPLSSKDARIQAAAQRRFGYLYTQELGTNYGMRPWKMPPFANGSVSSVPHRLDFWVESGCSATNPRVRLEAMRAVSRIPLARSAELVLDAALKTPPNDPHYEYAAWLSINDLAKPWTDAIASGEWKTEGREAQLAYGLKAIDPALANATLAKLLAQKKV
ncbi:MAG TPA: hypothetical protein VGO90_02525, partial [Chthoniobacteraceae bacterium]|nr:hypothetical protein [Chthoniobacteraceae bacterium]